MLMTWDVKERRKYQLKQQQQQLKISSEQVGQFKIF